MFDAIIFDFDGLILDTETPLYTAWRRTFEHFGVEPIGVAEWSASLGLHENDSEMVDPFVRLEYALQRKLAADEVHLGRRKYRDEILDVMPIQPGVVTVLAEAQEFGIPAGIASNSPREWIDRHLGPRGLLHAFKVIECAGDGVPGKPNPMVYLKACRALGVRPERSLALEDSPNGARAAKAAEMTCVVVPTLFSRDLDLTHADRVLTSLDELSLRGWQGSAGPGTESPFLGLWDAH